MNLINTHKAKTHLSQLLADVTEGKEFIIANAGKPVAVLSPYKEKRTTRQPGALAGKIKIADDFDDLPANFLKHFDNSHASA